MKPIKTNFVLLAFAAVFTFQQEAPAQYQVLNSTFSSGGGAANNSSFQIDCVIGEPAIGEGSNSSFAMQAGFVYAATSSQLPPSAWDFVANTGVNATIAVPAAINPTIGAQPLQSSDAVGVFFERNGVQICAGYSFWQPGENTAITAWGDNPQTPLKDGFAEGELIRYKIWAATEGREYEATVAYRSGGPNYTANGVYELSSLRGVTTVTHSNALAAGWNMISSYVEPASPGLETLLAGIIPKMVIMKNGRGQVFWPSLGINQIGGWNPRDGYQIFMQSPEALELTGNPIAPEATPIALQAGWSLVAYLRSGPMQIAQALESIKDNLIIVKNNAGQVYWPALARLRQL